MLKQICACTVSIGVVVLTVLMWMMINTLEYNQVGLNYSGIFSSVAKESYNPGIHVLGLGHYFLPYPTTLQTLEFSHGKKADLPTISCRTEDGLSLNLEISFQYEL
jgi:hypothetical protein